MRLDPCERGRGSKLQLLQHGRRYEIAGTARAVPSVEPHRLEALIFEDLTRYPNSRIGEVHNRIGPEIPRPLVERALRLLRENGRVTHEGERKGRRYRVA